MANNENNYYQIEDNNGIYPIELDDNNKYTIIPSLYSGDIKIQKRVTKTKNDNTHPSLKSISYNDYLLDYGSFVGRNSSNELSCIGKIEGSGNYQYQLIVNINNKNDDDYVQWFWLPPDEVLNNNIIGMTIDFKNTNISKNNFPTIYYNNGTEFIAATQLINNNLSATITFFADSEHINFPIIEKYEVESPYTSGYKNSYTGEIIKTKATTNLLEPSIDISSNNANIEISELSLTNGQIPPHNKYQLFFKVGDLRAKTNIFYINNVNFTTNPNLITNMITQNLSINNSYNENKIGAFYNVNSNSLNYKYQDEKAYNKGYFGTAYNNLENINYKIISSQIPSTTQTGVASLNSYAIYFSPGKIHGTIENDDDFIKIQNQDYYSDITTGSTNYFDITRPIFLGQEVN